MRFKLDKKSEINRWILPESLRQRNNTEPKQHWRKIRYVLKRRTSAGPGLFLKPKIIHNRCKLIWIRQLDQGKESKKGHRLHKHLDKSEQYVQKEEENRKQKRKKRMKEEKREREKCVYKNSNICETKKKRVNKVFLPGNKINLKGIPCPREQEACLRFCRTFCSAFTASPIKSCRHLKQSKIWKFCLFSGLI